MMETLLSIKLLRDAGAQLHGTRCMIAGRLVVGNGAAITIEDEGGLARLVVDDPTLASRLRRKVPIKIDHVLYDDRVEVVALIAIGRKGVVSISKIESGVLYRNNGREYVF